MNEFKLISNHSFVVGYIGVGNVFFRSFLAFRALVISVADVAVVFTFFTAENGKIVRAHNHILRRLHNGLTV